MKRTRRSVDEHASLIQSWIDSFDPASMPEEAAAFMYLLLGVEEMDLPRGWYPLP